MSDDKKRDRALQRRVRERQAKTGESYQAAWRQLTNSDPPTPVSQPAEENEIVFTSGRLLIPLHLPLVPPNQPTRVTGRPTHAVDVERLYITGAGTFGGAADWIVNDVEINGRSQLAHKDLPGSLFGGGGKVTAGFNGFDPVEREQALTLVVTYIGQNPEGCPLYASAVGIKPAQRPTLVPIASSGPLLPLMKTTIRVRLQNETLQIDRVAIQHGDTYGGAADWIVNDIRIGSTSQFVQSGDIPGDMFATNAIDTFVKIEACNPDIPFEIDVTYIGLNERGEIFDARLEGTVLRNDYSVAPPDLHAVVETVGKVPGIQVVGTCNWRAPASDNRTR